MSGNKITVNGAREHNLKNITVAIPRDQLVVITGVSGSGKSSLAFDTLYAEGQRRYVESLSAYARQFLGRMEKPDVDSIEGLSPSISIDQKGVSKNPRSTVGTVTEIYDYLRLMFARVGRRHCHQCGKEVEQQSTQEIVDSILKLPVNSKFLVLAPLIKHMRGEHVQILEKVQNEGFVRVRVNGIIHDLSEDIKLNRYQWHNIDVVVDRLILKKDFDKERLSESVESSLKLGGGYTTISLMEDSDDLSTDTTYSEHYACTNCDISLEELEPRSFSFNTPYGACDSCAGLGFKLEIDPDLIIPDQKQSINSGAIQPWSRDGRNSPAYQSTLDSIAFHYKFSLDIPVQDMTSENLSLILYGTQREKIKLVHVNKKGTEYEWFTDFEGIIPNMERRYNNTESNSIRENIENYMAKNPCAKCNGSRLKPEALSVTVLEMNIIEVTELSIDNCINWIKLCRDSNSTSKLSEDLPLSEQPLTDMEISIAGDILKEIESRLRFLSQVGLSYLSLDRTASTLSGGEGQRIRLATQIGSGLMGVLYVCDEPSVGLHPSDNSRLIKTLKNLRDVGNTVLIVEHDEAVMRAADHLIDLGPGAGEHGGYIVAEGDIRAITKNNESITGNYLNGTKMISMPITRRPGNGKEIIIIGARENNLKNITVAIPLGCLVCITGVSGSGKSTLINEILSKKLAHHFYKKRERPGMHDEIQGLNNVDKMINIDQSPIGRTPRSNPATYTGLFTPIRELFASMPEAKSRGYKPGRFSFNVKGGRCETCGGAGYLQIEMQFLPDVTVLCELCLGARYNREALDIKFKKKSISEVLDMTVSEATEHFNNIPSIRKKLETLTNVGLGYIKLGQPATTLSGGEAQRIKLASELSKHSTDSTLYILDEPTTGLSFDDVDKLLLVLQQLIDKGNTVILIEHHLDLIKSADWIIDLGPKAGARGGSIIAQGTPEYIASVQISDTGKYLSKMPNIVSNKKANGTVKSLLTPKLTIVGNQISPLKLLSKNPTLISPKSRSSKKHWRRRKKSIIKTGV